MNHVFVGASAFKYAKKLAAWNITKVSTGCGTSRDQSCMKHMLGEYNNLDVWATLNSCDRKTLWNAWYDIDEGIGRCGLVVCLVCVCACTPSSPRVRFLSAFIRNV